MLEEYRDLLTVEDLCEILMIGKKQCIYFAWQGCNSCVSDWSLLEDSQRSS